MAASGDVRRAYERFVSPGFIHHNAYFKGDRESLLRAMEQAHQSNPNKSLAVKRVLEDAEYVMTHSLVSRARAGQASIAVVHIFRIEGGKIVELWDIGQEVPKDSPNENGPF